MWFVFCKGCENTTNSNTLPSSYLPNSTIGIDSTFYVYGTPVVDASGDSTIKIFEAYKLMSSWKKKQWAVWNSGYSLEVTRVMIWERRGDLSGVILRCASAGVSILIRYRIFEFLSYKCVLNRLNGQEFVNYPKLLFQSPPMAMVEKLTGDKEGQIRITGFLADIWNGIQDVTNFS